MRASSFLLATANLVIANEARMFAIRTNKQTIIVLQRASLERVPPTRSLTPPMQRLRGVAALAFVGFALCGAQIDPPSVPIVGDGGDGGDDGEAAASNVSSTARTVDEPSHASIVPTILDADLLDLDAYAIAEIEEAVEPVGGKRARARGRGRTMERRTQIVCVAVEARQC